MSAMGMEQGLRQSFGEPRFEVRYILIDVYTSVLLGEFSYAAGCLPLGFPNSITWICATPPVEPYPESVPR